MPPKKRSFKVKSLTMLLYAVGIDKSMDDDFVNRVAQKIRLEPLSSTLNVPVDSPYIHCAIRMNLDDLKRS